MEAANIPTRHLFKVGRRSQNRRQQRNRRSADGELAKDRGEKRPRIAQPEARRPGPTPIVGCHFDGRTQYPMKVPETSALQTRK